MGDLIRIGEDYRLRFLPACYEQERHWLRRRSWQRAALAWVLVAVLAVVLGLARGML